MGELSLELLKTQTREAVFDRWVGEYCKVFGLHMLMTTWFCFLNLKIKLNTPNSFTVLSLTQYHTSMQSYSLISSTLSLLGG